MTIFIIFSTICGKFRPKMVAHLAHVCHAMNTFFMVMILSILQAVFTCHKALRYFPFAKRCLVMHLSIKRANNQTLANDRQADFLVKVSQKFFELFHFFKFMLQRKGTFWSLLLIF